MARTYQITEYGSFVRGKKALGSISLPPNTFDALENFVLSNRTENTEALEIMNISARKDVGKTITAKNYVGLITMCSLMKQLLNTTLRNYLLIC